MPVGIAAFSVEYEAQTFRGGIGDREFVAVAQLCPAGFEADGLEKAFVEPVGATFLQVDVAEDSAERQTRCDVPAPDVRRFADS